MGLLGWLSGEERGEKAVTLRISKLNFDRLNSEMDGRLNILETRIKKLEGNYGQYVQELRSQIEELEAENDTLNAQRDEATNIEAQRAKLMQLAPGAMKQAGVEDGQQAAVMQFLADPRNVVMIDKMLAQYFPDIPVTTEGLISLIPIMKTLLGGAAPQQNFRDGPGPPLF